MEKNNSGFSILQLMILVGIIPITTSTSRVIIVIMAIFYLLGEVITSAYNSGEKNDK